MGCPKWTRGETDGPYSDCDVGGGRIAGGGAQEFDDVGGPIALAHAAIAGVAAK